MSERTVVIADPAGLHARPAGLLTRAVAASGIEVSIRRQGGEPADARSILSVMSLNVKSGEEVILTAAAGPTSAEADRLLDELATMLTGAH
jgi:phosphocarrier protein